METNYGINQIKKTFVQEHDNATSKSNYLEISLHEDTGFVMKTDRWHFEDPIQVLMALQDFCNMVEYALKAQETNTDVEKKPFDILFENGC